MGCAALLQNRNRKRGPNDAGPPIPPPVRARIYLTRGPSVGFPTKVCLSPNENPARIPIGAGSREPSHLLGGRRARAPLRQLIRRARGSSRNVRHGKPTGHTFLETSGALTDWTPRAGAGCSRSLSLGLRRHSRKCRIAIRAARWRAERPSNKSPALDAGGA